MDAKSDPYANIDWSLPCAKVAKQVGKSLQAVYQERYRRGIRVHDTRCLPDDQQPSDHKLVRCKAGETFKCSNEDYAKLKKHCWYVHQGRPWTRYFGKLWTVHRMLFDRQMDHISGDPMDNRRENLRPATQQQNCFNQRKQTRITTSKFKGVLLRKHLISKPWSACVQKDRISHHLGYFATEEEAAHAYDTAAVKAFGEFAKLNFPVDTIR